MECKLSRWACCEEMVQRSLSQGTIMYNGRAGGKYGLRSKLVESSYMDTEA